MQEGKFQLVTELKPQGDQPQAIEKLTEGVLKGYREQTLIGVTGSGKSLDGEEPILVSEGDEFNPRIVKIGRLVDKILSLDPHPQIKGDTTYSPGISSYYALSISPKSCLISLKPITMFIRHKAPKKMYKVETECGREVTVTGDHNFWVLREGKLQLLKTDRLSTGDYIPVPRSLPSPQRPIAYLNLFELFNSENYVFVNNGWKFYVEANKIAKRLITLKGRKAIFSVLSDYYQEPNSKLYSILKNIKGQKIRLNVFSGMLKQLSYTPSLKELSQVKITSGKREYIPAIIPLSEEFLKLLGYYLAEGNAQERYFIIGVRENGDFQVSRSLWVNLLKMLIGSKAKDKHLPFFWTKLSQHQLSAMLRAYFEGDGWIETNSVCVLTASKQLASDLLLALLRFEIWARVKKIRKRANNSKHRGDWYWKISISAQENLRNFAEHIGFITARKKQALQNLLHHKADSNVDVLPGCKDLIVRWARISSISSISYNKKYVYDVSVKDDETFLAGRGGLFLHNTFTMANVIQNVQKPTLIISHNKTLAAQLFSEFSSLFPHNRVEYFVSYYDYYQPEAYVPQTDTYIEKDASINDKIDRMRHSATRSLLEHRDTIIVASVSCIYGLGSPKDYREMLLRLKVGEEIPRTRILKKLVEMRYERNDVDFSRGKFRVRGDIIEVFPAYEEEAIRIELWGDEIERISLFDPLTRSTRNSLEEIYIYPATHYLAPPDRLEYAIRSIEKELKQRLRELRSQGKLLEAERLESRTKYDLEMIREVGYCTGIENYSRYFSGRAPGERPSCLIDYFPKDYLLFIDESHQTIPQLHAMYGGDKSRKDNLVNYGFRLPSAYDNRPLKFSEFESLINQVIYVSATPSAYELRRSQQVVEQLIRPTGLVDPKITVKPATQPVDDLLEEIKKRVEKHQRVLVTTLTKRMAEDLTSYLEDLGIRVRYLHSEVETIERAKILRDLRLGKFDVLVGINLLREGLDLPEVSLVAILDADKEGFLRSETSLIQMAGRAARNIDGEVILYADEITSSMRRALKETERRRKLQLEYNKKHNITPQTIHKAILADIETYTADKYEGMKVREEKEEYVPPSEVPRLIKILEKRMRKAAENLEFEKAAQFRDRIKELKRIKTKPLKRLSTH